MKQTTRTNSTHLRTLLRIVGIAMALALAVSACSSDSVESITSTASETDEATPTTSAAAEPVITEEAAADPAATDDPTAVPADNGDNDNVDDDAAQEDQEQESATVVAAGVESFMDGALAADVVVVDCTLASGTETSCYQITVAGYPADSDVGPFCPTTTSDTADQVGIWLDGQNLYDIDGQFILDLPEIYNDDNWQLHDDDGHVHVTDTQEAFEAAARPDVAEEYQNHCVEGQIAWLDNGEPITSTVEIPVTPVASDSVTQAGQSLGVTLNGVIIAGEAPIQAILGAYTIAAFDDCGGHINPFDGYHLHGATGCSEVGDATDGETPAFAIAMDGYIIHSPLDEADIAAAELDQCNGHSTTDLGYHYHANNPEENAVLSCFTGETTAAASAQGGGRPGG